MSRFDGYRSRLRRATSVGVRGITQRVAKRAYLVTGAAELSFNLDLDDALTGVPGHLPVPSSPPARGAGLRIGWVMTPPGAGSGGHTTIFRMIRALEARGHACVVYLYDRHGLDVPDATERLRRDWRGVKAEVRDARGGIVGVDAVVATGWESVHVICRYADSPVHRLYFIQDYEPYFTGHGAEYELAAMTYRAPFRRIALGEMLDRMIAAETGLANDVVPFGCDSSAYALPAVAVPRSGVVFYSRPDTARRGYEIACIALRRFHRLHPDEEIHVYGAPPRGIGVPVTFHGRLSVPELNQLYGRTIAGLAMSFTNITLVAEEMLAAGNIPIVNEMALAHLVLPNPHVRWAEPTGDALAAALSDAVTVSDVQERARAAAASVVGRSWQPTTDAVTRIIENEVYRQNGENHEE